MDADTRQIQSRPEAAQAETAELAEQQKGNLATTAQVDRLRDELATVKAKAAAADAQRKADQLTAAMAERDQARQEASKAREDAARLAGQLQTHQEQTVAILACLAPAEAKPEDAVKPSKARK